ncbi:Hypothetical protein H16_A0385 [Cupriavidus necator H16]|uniref:Uncharacterized protein n=2 Tax=Cupriavidus necator TaxID=106590 RepID=Q0KEN6_CUPNH|nr:ORF99 [Cupriavidus necator H16]CAJ91535.1 Hypothetical protein H16_A0385 [Cupriavidus necator H16]
MAPEPMLFTRMSKGVRKRCAKVYAAPYKERESWPCPAPVHRLPAAEAPLHHHVSFCTGLPRCAAQCGSSRCSIMGRTPPARPTAGRSRPTARRNGPPAN